MKTSFKIMLVAATGLAIPVIASAADAAENWKTMCAKCHSPDGTGSGPMGKKYKLKDYTDPAVQAAMTDQAIFDAIKIGVPDTKMPGYSDKLADADITALVAYIRSLKKG